MPCGSRAVNPLGTLVVASHSTADDRHMFATTIPTAATMSTGQLARVTQWVRGRLAPTGEIVHHSEEIGQRRLDMGDRGVVKGDSQHDVTADVSSRHPDAADAARTCELGDREDIGRLEFRPDLGEAP